MWAADLQRERAYEEMNHSYSALSLNLPLAASCSTPVPSLLRRKAHVYNVVVVVVVFKKAVTTFIITNSPRVTSPANVIVHRSLHHWCFFLLLSCVKVKMACRLSLSIHATGSAVLCRKRRGYVHRWSQLWVTTAGRCSLLLKRGDIKCPRALGQGTH